MNKDLKDLSNKANLNKIAVVVIGFNRVDCLKWLTDSLSKATYDTDVPLIFSIDCSGCQEVYDFVENFEWPYGDKYVRIQSQRLGLKKHIYECGDLSQYFKAVIILEDDTFVTPSFYSYFKDCVTQYENEPSVTCISGYLNSLNGYAEVPFEAYMNGYDVIAMQEVTSTGECFTRRMWEDFRTWLDVPKHRTDEYINNVDMQPAIKRWKRAWTKYYNAYMVENNLYCIYPILSVVTNCGAIGEHSDSSNTFVQTNIEMGRRNYKLGSIEELTKYDIFFNNIDLYNTLNIDSKELCLDLYGTNPNFKHKRYCLSIKNLPFKISKSYAYNFRPPELNVKFDIPGNDLKLYDTSVPAKKCKGYIDYYTIEYFLHGFNRRLLRLYMPKWVIKTIRKKIL